MIEEQDYESSGIKTSVHKLIQFGKKSKSFLKVTIEFLYRGPVQILKENQFQDAIKRAYTKDHDVTLLTWLCYGLGTLDN